MEARKYLFAASKKGAIPSRILYHDKRRIDLKESEQLAEGVFLFTFEQPQQLFFGQELSGGRGDLFWQVLFPVFKALSQRKVQKLLELLSERDFAGIITLMAKWDREIILHPYLTFFGLSDSGRHDLLAGLERAGALKIFRFSDYYVLSSEFIVEQQELLRKILTQERDRESEFVKLDKIASRLDVKSSRLPLLYILKKLAGEIEVSIVEGNIVFARHELNLKQERILETVSAFLKKEKLVIFSLDQIKESELCRENELMQIIYHLWQEKELLQLSPVFFIFRSDFEKYLNRIKKHKRNSSELISIQELKELTGLSRKYLIPLLEYFDQLRITERIGNKRKITVAV